MLPLERLLIVPLLLPVEVRLGRHVRVYGQRFLWRDGTAQSGVVRGCGGSRRYNRYNRYSRYKRGCGGSHREWCVRSSLRPSLRCDAAGSYCDHYFDASALSAAGAEAGCAFLALRAAKNLSSRYGFFCACKVPRQNCVCCSNSVIADNNSLG